MKRKIYYLFYSSFSMMMLTLIYLHTLTHVSRWCRLLLYYLLKKTFLCCCISKYYIYTKENLLKKIKERKNINFFSVFMLFLILFVFFFISCEHTQKRTSVATNLLVKDVIVVSCYVLATL